MKRRRKAVGSLFCEHCSVQHSENELNINICGIVCHHQYLPWREQKFGEAIKMGELVNFAFDSVCSLF